MNKLKTILVYCTLIAILVFSILWFTDTLTDSYNPEYRPLLGFLEVMTRILQIAVTGL